MPATVLAAESFMPHRYNIYGGLITAFIVFGMAIFSIHQYGRVSFYKEASAEVSAEFWRTHTVTTTELDEYRPRWSAGKDRLDWGGGAMATNNLLVERHVPSKAGRYCWVVKNASDASRELIVRVNYFPGWHAVDDQGRKLATSPAPDTGLLRVMPIRPGASAVEVWFGDSGVRSRAKLVSMLSCVIAAIGTVVTLRRHRLATGRCRTLRSCGSST